MTTIPFDTIQWIELETVHGLKQKIRVDKIKYEDEKVKNNEYSEKHTRIKQK
tara:strand:- start:67 stop:222 length:156 start_codon:yes stop_codon:yes gene_type:complete